MATGTRQMLLDLAAEFEKTPRDQLDRFIGYAVTELGDKGVELYGDMYSQAVVYLAAHKLAVKNRGERKLLGSGRVTSQAVSPTGQQSVGFAPQLLNKLNSDEALRATPYGQEFLRIRNSLAASLPLTITSSS